MITYTVDFPAIADIIEDLNEEAHMKAFDDAANDVFLRATSKVVTQIKKKFNLGSVKENPYTWAFSSKLTGRTRKKSGRIRFFKKTAKNGSIKILIRGESIDSYLFNYGIPERIKATKSEKRKASLTRKYNKMSKRDKKKPVVKILRSGRVTTLDHAFFATMKSGHTGIFFRHSGEKKKINESRVITLVSMLHQVNYDKIYDDHYKANMPKRYEHYLKRQFRSSVWRIK